MADYGIPKSDFYKSSDEAYDDDVMPRAAQRPTMLAQGPLTTADMLTGAQPAQSPASSAAPTRTTADMLIGGGYTQQPVAKPSGDGDFVRGVKQAFGQTGQLAKGAGALVADTVGAKGIRDSLLDSYQKDEDHEQANSKAGDSFSENWDGTPEASWGTFLKHGAGYLLGQFAQTVGVSAIGAVAGSAIGPEGTVAGGIAGMIGREGVKSGIKGAVAGMIEKYAAKRAAEGMTIEAATQLAVKDAFKGMGAATALGSFNLVQEAGSIYPDAAKEAAEKGTDLNLGRVYASSIMAAGVETLGELVFELPALRGVKGAPGASVTWASRLKNGAKEAFISGLGEGSTELTQTALERYGANQDMTGHEAMRDYVDSTALGVLGGHMAGAVKGINTHATSAAEVDPKEQLSAFRGSVALADQAKATQREAYSAKLNDPVLGPMLRGLGFNSADADGIDGAIARVTSVARMNADPRVRAALDANNVDPMERTATAERLAERVAGKDQAPSTPDVIALEDRSNPTRATPRVPLTGTNAVSEDDPGFKAAVDQYVGAENKRRTDADSAFRIAERQSERKRIGETDGAFGEPRDLRDASAGGSTTAEGTEATAPKDVHFINVQMGDGQMIAGDQVEVLGAGAVKNGKGNTVQGTRVRLLDGTEQTVPHNEVHTFRHNTRFAQEIAARSYAPPNGVNIDPASQPQPRDAAQRVMSEPIAYPPNQVDRGVHRSTPESAAQIAAQMRALADPNSTKDAVFVAKGNESAIPKQLPNGVQKITRDAGTLITSNQKKASAYQNAPALDDRMMADLLGYPESKETAIGPNSVVVQAKDKGGNVVSEMASSPGRVTENAAALAKQAPGGSIEVKSPVQMQEERAAGVAQEQSNPTAKEGPARLTMNQQSNQTEQGNAQESHDQQRRSGEGSSGGRQSGERQPEAIHHERLSDENRADPVAEQGIRRGENDGRSEPARVSQQSNQEKNDESRNEVGERSAREGRSDGRGAEVGQASRADAEETGGRPQAGAAHADDGHQEPVKSKPAGKGRRVKRAVAQIPLTADEYGKLTASTFLQRLKAAGGIHSSLASDITGERAMVANRGAGAGLFRKTGMMEDELAFWAIEDGYLTRDQEDDNRPEQNHAPRAFELVQDALRGEPVMQNGQAEHYAALRAKELDEHEANDALRDSAERFGIDWRGLTPDELHEDVTNIALMHEANRALLDAEIADRLDAAEDRQTLRESGVLEEAMYHASHILGDIDIEAIQKRVAEKHDGASDAVYNRKVAEALTEAIDERLYGEGAGAHGARIQETVADESGEGENGSEFTDREHGREEAVDDATPDRAASARSEAAAGSADRGGSDAGSESAARADEAGLTSYTADEIRAAEAKKETAAKKRGAAEKKAEQKAKADEDAKEFTLTGSDRASDANANQGDMLAAAPQQASDAATLKRRLMVAVAKGDIDHELKKDLLADLADGRTDTVSAVLDELDTVSGLEADPLRMPEWKSAGNAIDIETTKILKWRQPVGMPNMVAVGLDLREADPAQRRVIEQAISELVTQGGLPKALLSRLDSIMVRDLPFKEGVALATYWPDHGMMTVNRAYLDALAGRDASLDSGRLADRRRMFVGEMAHELAHAADFFIGADQSRRGPLSSHMQTLALRIESGKVIGESRVVNEILRAMNFDQNVARFFGYPLAHQALIASGNVNKIKAELFAQIVALYRTNPKALRDAAPFTFKIAENLVNGIEKNIIARADGNSGDQQGGSGVSGEIRGGRADSGIESGLDDGRLGDEKLRGRVERSSGGEQADRLGIPARSAVDAKQEREEFGGTTGGLSSKEEIDRQIRELDGLPEGYDTVAHEGWVKDADETLTSAIKKAGIYTQPKSWKAVVAEKKSNWRMRFTQAVADQFAPLKELDQRAYILARMSKSTDGALEALMFHGRVVMDADGGLDVGEGRGVLDILKDLKGEHNRFMSWLVGMRAEQLKREGRENLFDDAEIGKLTGLSSGALADGTNRTALYHRVNEQLRKANESVLDVALRAGLIDKAAHERFRNDKFYVPFFRVKEDGSIEFKQTGSGLVNQKQFRTLKGGTEQINDPLQNMMNNWSAILSASAKNVAAVRALEVASNLGIASEVESKDKGTVAIRVDGKDRHYMIDDPLVMEAVSALSYTGFNSSVMKVLGKFRKWLTFGATISPTFKINNLIRDSISAIGTSHLGYNAFDNIAKGWSLTAHDNPIRKHLLAGGALFRFGTVTDGDNAHLVRRLIDNGVDGDTILTTPEKAANLFKNLFNKYHEIGDRGENANRAALYQKLRDEGMSHLEASYHARDLMDFSLTGNATAIRFLNQVVPFLNARIQGLYKLGRASKDDPRKFAVVAGAVSMASIALYTMFKDDEEFKKREDWDRDNFWWANLGGTQVRIPKPFELGAMATILERGLEQMVDENTRGKDFVKSLKSMVSNTFAFNPLPQMFKPLVDLYGNKDSFTDRPIESMGMERRQKQDRWDGGTTMAARLVGQATSAIGLSPKQIDFLAQAYFGWVGSNALRAADYALRPAMGEPDRPASSSAQTPVIGTFIRTESGPQSKYVTRFYDGLNQVSEVYASINYYKQIGDIEKATEIATDNQDLLATRKLYTRAQQMAAKMTKDIHVIEQSRDIDADEKRARIDAITTRRNDMMERVDNAVRSRKAA